MTTDQAPEPVTLNVVEMRRKWEAYAERLQEGDGGGSLIGASFIIAKSGVTDVLRLLDVLEGALEMDDDEI